MGNGPFGTGSGLLTVLVGPAREVLEAVRRAEVAVRPRRRRGGSRGDRLPGSCTHGLVGRLAPGCVPASWGVQLELSSQNFAQPAMKELGDTDIALGRWDATRRSVPGWSFGTRSSWRYRTPAPWLVAAGSRSPTSPMSAL